MSVVSRLSSSLNEDAQAIGTLYKAFALQKQSQRVDPYPTFDERVRLMNEVVRMVLGHREAMKAALHEDFGWHPAAVGELIEILGIAGRADYNIRHLAGWMKSEERETDPALWGTAKATVRPQPKGVIGNMVPWNFPFDIAFGPLLDMLGAGNRVILKPSDLGPACGELIGQMVTKTFAPERVTVVVGGLELAKAFPTLAWDHLLYTGSPAIGKAVMRAAAENLVPVTLELGGKSPAIIAADAVNERTVASLIGTKRLKSGQVCVAPDHVFVPRGQVERFIALSEDLVASQAAEAALDLDTTGIIARRHLERLQAMLAQARAAGCRIIELGDRGTLTHPARRQMLVSLVIAPPPELDICSEEIFGPVLPVIPYDDIEAVIASVNAGARPLGLYVYAQDSGLAEHVLARTVSGGACAATNPICSMRSIRLTARSNRSSRRDLRNSADERVAKACWVRPQPRRAARRARRCRVQEAPASERCHARCAEQESHRLHCRDRARRI